MQDCYNKYKKALIDCLANEIKTQRQKNKKSISLLSAEIGMTKSMWADLEKGIKDPQLSTIWRICQGLGIPLSTVIKDIEEKLGKDFSLID